MKKFLLSLIVILALCLGVVACGDGQKITVTFDGNGGVTADGQSTVAVDIRLGDNYKLPNFYREGYEFVGWDTDVKQLTEDATVKALWEINKYTVTFDLDGGSIKEGSNEQTVEYGSNATAPEVEKSGYTLKGWDGSLENITKDTTVKAIWERNKYTVTFDLNGGKLADDAQFEGTLVDGTNDKYVLTVEHGSFVDYPKVTHDNEGLKLSGWNGDSLDNVTSNVQVTANWVGIDGDNEHTVTFVLGKENVVYTGDLEQIIPLNGNAVAPEVQDLPYYKFMGWTGDYTDVVGNVTITARWQEIKYEVTFDLDGGTLLTGSLTQETIEGKVVLPTVEKDGYAFNGWFDGEEKVNQDTLYTKDTVLKAKWTQQIIINFNSNGGSACESKTINSGEKLGTLPTPSKGFPGEYSFKYWYYIDGSGKQIQVTSDTVLDIDTNEITLYAYFKLLWTGFY